MALNIVWGNHLESLADGLFAKLAEKKVSAPDAIFAQRDCIVVPNRIQQAWLQQHFLFDMPPNTPGVPPVLANVDFPLLGIFVNDWLHRMQGGNPTAHPVPEEHPFSVKSLRWKIYDFLCQNPLKGDYAVLDRFVQGETGRCPRKCFKLASRLAALFDQYQIYRPEMMVKWEAGQNTDTDANTAWEPALWRHLIQGNESKTYLAAFRTMKANLKSCGIAEHYRRIFVFAPSMLPPTHLEFFRLLGNFIEVDFYLFNPAQEDWFDRESLKKKLREPTPDLMDCPKDDIEWSETMPMLLEAFGRGARDLAAQALDLSGGQIEDVFSAPESDSLLHALQHSLATCDASMERTPRTAPDDSIQIHQCHGNMREVEILRDQLFRCFADFPKLQPRDIQVQVGDLNAYSPYIDAVFQSLHPGATGAIPFVIADTVMAGEGQAAEAFRQLLEISKSRFTAPEVLNILRYEGIAKQFGFAPNEIAGCVAWVQRAGVRWGRNATHRTKASGAEFGEETTWQHGLDRLILGYALGDESVTSTPIFPCDCVEGDSAIRLGGLVRFYEKLTEFATASATPHTLEEWAKLLDTLVKDFFVSDDKTYTDVAILKRAIELLRTSGSAAQFNEKIPMDVVSDFLTGHLGETASSGKAMHNKVVFSSLRPGSSTPRKVQCLLGMGDSLFPRTENRPAYDLLRVTRKIGDRSASIEDRAAFIEVLLNARERLLIFYPAFSEKDNTPACESVAVRELTEFLDRKFAPCANTSIVPKTTHRLQPWNTDYFLKNNAGKLFSYSQTQFDTAKALLQSCTPAAQDASPAPPQSPVSVDIQELACFFENPAKHYYKKVLGADPALSEEKLPADSETFAPDHREKWSIRKHLLDSFAHNDPDTARELVLKKNVADGIVPLGRQGAKWVKSIEAEAQALLEQPVPPFGTLCDALIAQQSATRREWSLAIDVDNVAVTLFGAASCIGDTLFDVKASRPKNKRVFGTWLVFLLAAAAENPIACVNAQQTEKGNNLHLTPFSTLIATDKAQIILADLLRLYLFHTSPPIPFTPESSWEQVNGRDAKKIWKSTDYHHGEDGDAHFMAQFGRAGPMASSSFAETATRILNPLKEYLAPPPPPPPAPPVEPAI